MHDCVGQGASMGPRDRAPATDRATTNLYVGNLAAGTTEEHVLGLFGAFGPIASLKMMWPRHDGPGANVKFCACV